MEEKIPGWCGRIAHAALPIQVLRREYRTLVGTIERRSEMVESRRTRRRR
jgi:hypothetical protein